MRKIDKIIVHCTYTPEGRDVPFEDVRGWHVNPPPRGNGWSDIGYHFLIGIDGRVDLGRDVSVPGAHTLGQNKFSIGIAYTGGMKDGNPCDTRTPAQKESLLIVIRYLKKLFPNAKVYGHCDFSIKNCPCFNAKEEYKGA